MACVSSRRKQLCFLGRIPASASTSERPPWCVAFAETVIIVDDSLYFQRSLTCKGANTGVSAFDAEFGGDRNGTGPNCVDRDEPEAES